jgi:hypothetical protein
MMQRLKQHATPSLKPVQHELRQAAQANDLPTLRLCLPRDSLQHLQEGTEMKLNAFIELAEAHQILQEHLAAKFGVAVGTVTITSYEKAKIVFHEDGFVEAVEFRHKSQ